MAEHDHSTRTPRFRPLGPPDRPKPVTAGERLRLAEEMLAQMSGRMTSALRAARIAEYAAASAAAAIEANLADIVMVELVIRSTEGGR